MPTVAIRRMPILSNEKAAGRMLSRCFARGRGGEYISKYPITANSPPALITSAKDDDVAPTEFAVGIAKSYEKAGVTHMLWLVENGGHRAFSFDSKGEGSEWRTRFVDWLSRLP